MQNIDGSVAKRAFSDKGGRTPTALFDYDLPEECIAQRSVLPRDEARLLVLDRSSGVRTHACVLDLPTFLRAGDTLVFNDTKVFNARLMATCRGRVHEVLLLRALLDGHGTSQWEVILRGAKRLHAGDVLLCDGVMFVLRQKPTEKEAAAVEAMASVAEVHALCDRVGHIPVPPYVKEEPKRLEDYQTIYAKHVGSVAAPTSGFHFTPRLFQALEKRGIEKAFVTLHVGGGTFVPVKTETLEEHRMHAEWVSLSKETVACIRRTKERGGRVIAVGTTTVRTLEGIAECFGELRPYEGEINLFITPGFSFRVIDGLVTNFHLPRSTLLALVSAFAGREGILQAYREAIANGYRFFSFGDAMFIR
ncbi:tRNA preQ1(34) S-adenosylmethionine ribosyltransferase-isomerase QueA [Candidatus Uhrbacteria bacterium]|nr:tRNA preQ1(34) S-adenosylmethionine ribosyltransferase-isomerase QueA [Candidatus Uhrbacteria bacterium]